MNSNEDETLDLIDVELDLIDEVWKELDRYNATHEISNYGRVRNAKTGRLLTLREVNGRVKTTLTSKHKTKVICVEELVTEYFPEGHLFDPDRYEELNKLGAGNSIESSEVWRDIQGFEGLYQVSSLGRIKSVSRKVHRTHPNGTAHYTTIRGRILRLHTKKSQLGYAQIGLSKDGKVSEHLVHRLVARAFIENLNRLPQVNHIDGNKFNNVVENLEWVSACENMAHARETGLLLDQGADSALAKLDWDAVRYIREGHGLLQRELADMFGVSSSTIQRVARYEVYKNDPMEEKK